MRKFFLTLDLEEWYHLEYVKEYKDIISSEQRFASKVIPFLKTMADNGVYLTVFVLEETARENRDIVKQIADLGHEIGCHGKEHELVYELTTKEFRKRIGESKKVLEDIIGKPIKGYRAPCFSMENEKFDVLWDLGFIYDASLIRFKEHKLYNVMDMSSFDKMESMIYRKGDKYEFETPTLEIMGKSIPISGGGYFRLFPLWLMKYFMRKHWEKEDNFVFYIHPFEIVGETLENGKRMGTKNHFRFQVGRPGLSEKLIRYIKWLKKQNVEFMKFSDYIDLNSHEEGIEA
ncbi:polysaccharide deacetylase family protein, PEP-CTERM locus subfamily [Dethiosulfatibacter aminovorans DSM 17477]|uniref:Polysaccharide deacetylase family protein, PEP-CTERM locus subfamily n=1 Tax=Dethiosulfatibacter aminovorans DSM 17477 TaxID=1121476 RepID=A0A1M6IKC3_9FIRM|nr:polysaccharide deacetylase family protein [Dethiosulfatibacter aminovorans]SHJ34952.1 polysaccharide deacetylase family protein, PEP-CTERM locus subfamily [Dethiosulfatibacter aminovorans DSM 17477]